MRIITRSSQESVKSLVGKKKKLKRCRSSFLKVDPHRVPYSRNEKQQQQWSGDMVDSYQSTLYTIPPELFGVALVDGYRENAFYGKPRTTAPRGPHHDVSSADRVKQCKDTCMNPFRSVSSRRPHFTCSFHFCITVGRRYWPLKLFG